jgi:hypothetical protein
MAQIGEFIEIVRVTLDVTPESDAQDRLKSIEKSYIRDVDTRTSAGSLVEATHRPDLLFY